VIQRAAGALFLLSLLTACARSPQVASAPTCPPSWHAEWTGDSAIALCLPATFKRRAADAWSRPDSGVAADLLSVVLLRWPEDSASLHGWPPHLASPPACLADCATVDSLSVHSDQVADMEARTEVGLVSGGMPGFRRQPMLRVGWEQSARRRGVAQGWAANAATLDTLRLAVRTLRIAP
jgi:hypothetical protein